VPGIVPRIERSPLLLAELRIVEGWSAAGVIGAVFLMLAVVIGVVVLVIRQR
jgi:hypothetical protein